MHTIMLEVYSRYSEDEYSIRNGLPWKPNTRVRIRNINLPQYIIGEMEYKIYSLQCNGSYELQLLTTSRFNAMGIMHYEIKFETSSKAY